MRWLRKSGHMTILNLCPHEKESIKKASPLRCGIQIKYFENEPCRPERAIACRIIGDKREPDVPLAKRCAQGRQRPGFGTFRRSQAAAQASQGTGDGTGYFKKSIGHFQPSGSVEVCGAAKVLSPEFGATKTCAAPGVSRSAYHAWLNGQTYVLKGTKKSCRIRRPDIPFP